MNATLETSKVKSGVIKPSASVAPKAGMIPVNEWNTTITWVPLEQWIALSDIVGEGYGQQDLERIADDADRGDPQAQTMVDKTIEVQLEAMYRARIRKHVENSSGKLLYWNEHGQQTTDPVSKTAKDASGSFIQYQKVEEWRSAFDVGQGRDIVSAPGTPVGVPGFWVKTIRNNKSSLFRALKFRDLNPVFNASDYPREGSMREAEIKFKENLTGKNGPRAKTLAWLKPFLASGAVCKWTGEPDNA